MLSRAKSLLLNTALAVALLAGAVAVAAETGMIVTKRPPEAAPSVLERPTPRITVRAKVKGLYPGASKKMKVGVHNRLGRRVRLVSVRSHPQDASPDCSRTNLRIERFRGGIPIRPHERARVRVKVTMEPTAPDACQGVRFPIHFKARVTGKRR
ncbi:MAG TPA: hypothetical protein VD766_05150 [Solirubrobacterales bacterium]|nr:hypothetical protein [Solirubrobacterales bacterium]